MQNYTDCERLIYIPDLPGARRYLFHCDAIYCCYEEQGGNQVQFQIPNAKVFGKEPEVKNNGTHDIEVWSLVQPYHVNATEWEWKALSEHFRAYTTGGGFGPNPDDPVQLHSWKVSISLMPHTY
jgi:hypothetical protein